MNGLKQVSERGGGQTQAAIEGEPSPHYALRQIGIGCTEKLQNRGETSQVVEVSGSISNSKTAI